MEKLKTKGMQEILTDLKSKKITFFDAEKQLEAFSKQGLIWWILKEFQPMITNDLTSIREGFDSHQKNLPGENKYGDIKM